MVSTPLPKNMKLRPMRQDDIGSILGIIRQHDEEDFELAREVYGEGGLEDQYVLAEDEEAKGVTGFEYIDGTDNSYWLTRSFLYPQLQERGLAPSMIQELLGILFEMGARKVFVNTSDSLDSMKAAKRREEIEWYESLGFRLELNYKDYYQAGESRFTYGRRVGRLYVSRPTFEPDTRGLDLVDVSEIEETLGAYVIEWDYADDAEMFSVNDLNKQIKRAERLDGRCIFIGFPSNLPHAAEVLNEAGFRQCGRLIDFYEDGIDEIHYRIDLK